MPAPVTNPERSAARGGRWWSQQRLALVVAAALVVVCVAPVVMSGFDGLGRVWHPAGDWSVLELRTRDVGSASTPLVGPYSRYGWNHPGPLLFWVLAVPYRLLGRSSASMMLGAALVNVAAIAGVAVFAWRRGRLPLLAAVTAGLAILCTHLGPSFLRDPWNPSLTALPFALALMLAWSAGEGDRPALALLAFVGSFLVQAHIGFAALVAVLWVIGTVGFCRGGRPGRRVMGWSVAVLAVCWLPVLYDQLVGTGNFGDLVRYFIGGSAEPAAGWHTALATTAKELGGVAPWLGGAERADSFNGAVVTNDAGLVVVPLVAFAAAFAVACARRARSAVRLQLVVLATSFVGFVSVARITGPAFAYLVRWLWVLALFWWLSTFWSFWSALFADRRVRELGPSWVVARDWATALLVVLAFAVVARTSARTAAGIDDIGTPDGEWYVTVDVITDDVVSGVPHDGPVLVRAVGTSNGSITDALALQLDRHGVPVAVDDEQTDKYGQARSARSRPPVATMTVASGALLEGPFGASFGTAIANWDPLTPEERQYAEGLEQRLVDDLSLIGRDDLVDALHAGRSIQGAHDLDGVDQDLLQAVEKYRSQGDPVTVYVDGGVTEPVDD